MKIIYIYILLKNKIVYTHMMYAIFALSDSIGWVSQRTVKIYIDMYRRMSISTITEGCLIIINSYGYTTLTSSLPMFPSGKTIKRYNELLQMSNPGCESVTEKDFIWDGFDPIVSRHGPILLRTFFEQNLECNDFNTDELPTHFEYIPKEDADCYLLTPTQNLGYGASTFTIDGRGFDNKEQKKYLNLMKHSNPLENTKTFIQPPELQLKLHLIGFENTASNVYNLTPPNYYPFLTQYLRPLNPYKLIRPRDLVLLDNVESNKKTP